MKFNRIVLATMLITSCMIYSDGLASNGLSDKDHYTHGTTVTEEEIAVWKKLTTKNNQSLLSPEEQKTHRELTEKFEALLHKRQLEKVTPTRVTKCLNDNDQARVAKYNKENQCAEYLRILWNYHGSYDFDELASRLQSFNPKLLKEIPLDSGIEFVNKLESKPTYQINTSNSDNTSTATNRSTATVEIPLKKFNQQRKQATYDLLTYDLEPHKQLLNQIRILQQYRTAKTDAEKNRLAKQWIHKALEKKTHPVFKAVDQAFNPRTYNAIKEEFKKINDQLEKQQLEIPNISWWKKSYIRLAMTIYQVSCYVKTL